MDQPGRGGTKPLRKKEAQFRHAVRRADERYGIHLNKDRYRQLCKQIQENRGDCLGRQSNRLTVWRITADQDGQQIRCNVVYDKSRHQIVTFLPEGITDAKGVAIGPEVVKDDSLYRS